MPYSEPVDPLITISANTVYNVNPTLLRLVFPERPKYVQEDADTEYHNKTTVKNTLSRSALFQLGDFLHVLFKFHFMLVVNLSGATQVVQRLLFAILI